jgi:DNA-binding transcriptional LysR family regulator
VRLGIGTLLKDTLLPRLLLKIVEEHPRLRLEIEFGAAPTLFPRVENRTLDMALCVTAPSATLAHVEALQAEVIFVAAPTHPLAGEKRISVERFAQFPCAGSNTPGYVPSIMLGLPSATATLDAYVSNDFEGLTPLVHAGHATLVTPSFFVQQALRAGELVRLDVDWTGAISFGCYTTQAVAFSPILARITRYAVELGAEIQAEWRI